jgi:hypothetical protein
MCGCVVGPFRSDSNYLTVTEQTLFDCVFRVHREIFRLAGHSLTVSYQSPTAGKLVGKCVQSLTEWARSAARTLEQVSEPAELAAAHQWLSAVHGRRPTADPFPKIAINDVNAAYGAQMLLSSRGERLAHALVRRAAKP